MSLLDGAPGAREAYSGLTSPNDPCAAHGRFRCGFRCPDGCAHIRIPRMHRNTNDAAFFPRRRDVRQTIAIDTTQPHTVRALRRVINRVARPRRLISGNDHRQYKRQENLRRQIRAADQVAPVP